jgi:hypothetical protein
VRRATLVIALAALVPCAVQAQERPSFITYNHHMEEPGAFEAGLTPVIGTQRGGGAFIASWLELEYGVRAWWTAELYLDGQATRGEGSALTGFRIENRARVLMGEHRVNPVLYAEYESISGADKTLLEVVGHDGEEGHAEPLREARREHKHELELKAILSGNAGSWTLAHNLIVEKNFAEDAWEFGYAMAASRPFADAAAPEPCRFCRENFAGGVEMYGGLGETGDLGLRGTSHYAAAFLSWSLPGGTTLRVSPTVGLNARSHRFLLRFGIAREFGIGR